MQGRDNEDNKCFVLRRSNPHKAQGAALHQGFLSEFSGLSVSFISDLENGKKTAELEKAIYLANLLGMDLSLKGREHDA